MKKNDKYTKKDINIENKSGRDTSIKKSNSEKTTNKKMGKWVVGEPLDDKSTTPYKSTTHTTHLPNYPYYPKLNIKDKILFILYDKNEILTIKEISEILNESLIKISKQIKRKDRESGLYYEEYLDVYDESNGIKWGLTEKGKDYVDKIIILEQQKKDVENEKVEKLEAFNDYYKQIEFFLNDGYIKVDSISNDKFVEIDFNDVIKECPELGEKLEDDFENQKTLINQMIPKGLDVLFKNIPKHCYKEVGSLDYNDFNKLIVIEGMVKGRSDRRPQITSSRFECPACGNIIPILQLEKKFKEPSKCGCGRKGGFVLLNNELVTVQRLELEEFSENLKGVNEPRNINLILKNNLCDPINQKDFNPGMRVKFWGTLKSDWVFKGLSKQTLLDYYFEVNGYEVLDQSLEFNVCPEDKEKIYDFVKKDNFFDILSRSFCPEISGNKIIKKSLLLCAVKGKVIEPRYKRDRIHVLLVSDPGHGKTILVKKLISITPYSRFTSGLNSSKAGLTASVVKDEFVGGWRLSAGAVPLANNGICVVDEMDKFQDDDKKALNGVMEEGEVVIDKATVHQRLKANTVIVATCNPTNERFDYNTPKIDQLNLPRSLVDRFDIVFVVNGKNGGNPFMDITLDVDDDLVDDDFISKFLILAMNHDVNISKSIEKYIADFAFCLKKGFSDFDFGFRQFHALFRLSVAFAKINFRKEVVRKDVQDAGNILIKSLESLNIYFSGDVI